MDAGEARYLSINEHLKKLAEWMSDPAVNEIAVNRPGEVEVWKSGRWIKVEASQIDANWLVYLGRLLANISSLKFDEQLPILSAYLPGGERVEMTMPPCSPRGVYYLNIRKHTSSAYTLEEFVAQGYFAHTKHLHSHTLKAEDRAEIATQLQPEQLQLWQLATSGRWLDFLTLSVLSKQNLVVSGATGAGKTSFIRAMIEKIPNDERLITVEDTPEMPLHNHPNNNALFYRRETPDVIAANGATAKQVLQSCMRKTPSRVLLAEMRGDETFFFLQGVLNSGHPGGMSTVHANSPKEAFIRLAMLIKSSDEGRSLGLAEIMQLLHTLVHVVLQLVFDLEKGRHIPAIYYDPMYAFSLVK
jgi:type IV secretion system protein VirB11